MLEINFCKRWAGKKDKDWGNPTKDARKSLLYVTCCIIYKKDFILNLFAYLQADRRSAQAGLGMKTYAVVTDDYRQVFYSCYK